jgi:hypothetical protein
VQRSVRFRTCTQSHIAAQLLCLLLLSREFSLFGCCLHFVHLLLYLLGVHLALFQEFFRARLILLPDRFEFRVVKDTQALDAGVNVILFESHLVEEQILLLYFFSLHQDVNQLRGQLLALNDLKDLLLNLKFVFFDELLRCDALITGKLAHLTSIDFFTDV